MIDGIRDHAFEEAEAVRLLGEMRELITHPSPALAMLIEFIDRPLSEEIGLELGHAQGFPSFENRGRQGLTALFCQDGFPVKRLELGEAAAHEETDHPFGLGRKMR